MISGIFHSGSGCGNQLFRYVATRVIALDRGYDFSMIAPENFKGSSFMNLDMGNQDSPTPYITETATGRVIPVDGEDKSNASWLEVSMFGGDSYDPNVNFIEDGAIIDGEFQGERHFGHRLDEIRGWLDTKRTMKVPDDVCIVNFRGGEYVGVRYLFLPLSYWTEAMVEMRKINPNIKFRIVTDDVETAKVFFQGLDMEVGHDMEEDWLAIRYAKYLILSNSSFAILPALLNENAEKIIAPLYWAGRNTGVWTTPANYYSKFHYI